MKEEEIIIILKDMIGCDRREYNSTQVYAIQGLLDLYEKEKEKNKELLEERKSYAEEYIHNNPWLYKQLNELYVFKTEVEKNYISKDKIRKKVIEIKNKKAENDFITTTQGKLDTIIALESLLEEE